MVKKSYVLMLIILFSSCINKTKDYKKLEIWEKILKSVEEENINYLLKISSDTLQCVVCNNGKDWIKKELFFKNHINQMQLGGNKNYSYYMDDINDSNNKFKKRYRITYSKKYKGNKYDIIYTILQNNNKIKFQGVFSIP